MPGSANQAADAPWGRRFFLPAAVVLLSTLGCGAGHDTPPGAKSTPHQAAAEKPVPRATEPEDKAPAKTEAPAEAAPRAEQPADPPKAPEDASVDKPPKKRPDKPTPGRQLPSKAGGKLASREPCGPGKLCAEGLACSGLFERKPGKCIPKNQVQLQCDAARGEWGKWGRRQAEFCMEVHADGGKACRDSSECNGKCLQSPQQKAGACERHRVTYGCNAEVTGGKPGNTICLD